jgi:hypothetical protein
LSWPPVSGSAATSWVGIVLAEDRLIEVPRPDQQVLDRRGQPAFAALRIGVRGAAEALRVVAEIAGGEVGITVSMSAASIVSVMPSGLKIRSASTSPSFCCVTFSMIRPSSRKLVLL